jgi:glutaredoxin
MKLYYSEYTGIYSHDPYKWVKNPEYKTITFFYLTKQNYSQQLIQKIPFILSKFPYSFSWSTSLIKYSSVEEYTYLKEMKKYSNSPYVFFKKSANGIYSTVKKIHEKNPDVFKLSAIPYYNCYLFSNREFILEDLWQIFSSVELLDEKSLDSILRTLGDGLIYTSRYDDICCEVTVYGNLISIETLHSYMSSVKSIKIDEFLPSEFFTQNSD